MTMNSNLRILRRAALAACVLAGVLGMSRAVLADTVLRYSPRLPDNYAINSGALRPFMVEVEKVTEGRVRFEWLPKPLGTPRGQFDVVHDGVADMSVIVPGYTPGRFNAAELGELPLLSCDIDILAASFSEIYAERLQNLDMFEGTHVLSICSTTPSHVAPNNTAIRSLDDFKGQKLRVQNPTAAAILEQVSAVPSQKPVSEMYKMGASGIIDGGISPISVNGLFKTRAFFNKVTPVKTISSPRKESHMTDKPSSPQLPPYGPPISLADAKRVMAAAEKKAEAEGWPMIITILDSGGHTVMQHKMDSANLGGIGISALKARTAVNFRRPSKIFEDLVAGGGLHLRLLAASDVVAPMEGGIPLMADGKVIGAIGVSGMASHEDGQVAQAGADAL